ncbi:carboxypeptidase-like regulatory domain-containing protein [Hymenobacter sp. BRD67]|uniref:TonB-dependent receptor n=1 Tax=Hymenobacter sp. BRD67 TaxID=2675877 RepID=UPI00293B8D88|nr:carboxypeptidase-like regulatory domain-containing protein [Hymenobacter sp. BRD67]
MSLLLGYGVAGYGQQGPPPTISGDFRQLPFAEFVRQLAATTPYRFYYKPADVDSVRITLQVVDQPLDEVLRHALRATSLQFAIAADHRVYITTGIAIETRLPDNFFQPAGKEPVTQAGTNPAAHPVVAGAVAGKVYELGLDQASSNGKATITGRVREARSGEPVVGASVYVENPTIGVSTDQFGSYTLTLPVGRQRLNLRGLGIKNTVRLLNLHGNGKLDIEVEEDITPLKEVVIEAEKDHNVTSMQMGVQKLDIKTIKQVPTVFGEADILRVILTLPGVKSVGEGNTGMSVRGGGTDQNLVLFNDATIYNPSHLFGFFSAFNPDMLKSVELYKSTVPARYGGRLSSVLDIATRDGNRKKIEASGGIGLLTSRLTLEGPLAKGKGSFLVAGRTSYSDWLLKQLPSKSLNSSAASFYDLSAHIAYDFSDRNSLYATGYYSRDRFRLATDTVYNYSNLASSLKWKHVISDKLYGVLTGTFSRYQYSLSTERNPITASQLSYNLNQGGVQADFSYFPNARHTIEFGGSSLFYQIAPGSLSPLGSSSLVVNDVLSTERALESALYISDRFDISPRFSVAAGLRYSLYNALGPRDVNEYQPGISLSESTITGITSYGSGKVLATYQGPEYRLSAKYAASANSSVKLSLNRMRQYIHQLTNTTVVSPTDSWKLSDRYIRPQVGDQASVGYYRNFKSNTIETSVEAYYKVMHDFLDYKGGATLLLNHHLETDVVNGEGRAYGVELMVRKSTGKLNGWLSYTYSRSLVQVNTGTDIINGGSYYPSNFDKPMMPP